MEKINFVNDSEPYLSAENLNKMQSNIETAINGVVLYENETGSYESITLSDSAANYKYIELFFQAENNHNSIKVYKPNEKNVYTQMDAVYGDATYVKKSKWYISNNTIAIGVCFNYAITNSLVIQQYGNNSQVAITRVIGYK